MARSATQQPPLPSQLLAYVRQRNEAGVKKMLAAGCSVDGSSELDWRPIMAAAASGKVSMAELLIERGADLDLGSLDDLRCSDGLEVLGKGVRALHVAINHYHVNMFRALLKAGANPNSTNGKGLTPLMLTCILEDTGRGAERAIMTRELLEAGADPSLADFQGKTALGFAAARNQTYLIDILLLKAPASLNRATPDGLTPLHAAAMSGKDEAVSHLLAAGAVQPLVSAEKDMCPLVAAVRENHEEVVRVLLTARGIEAIGGSDAIPRAVGAAATARKGKGSIMHMLLSAEGEDRRQHWASCRYKEDPVLHCAVSFGNMSAARVLLAAGADEMAENTEGRWAGDVVGFNAPSLHRDPGRKGAIVRMLTRGPAFRAFSYGWPAGSDTATGHAYAGADGARNAHAADHAGGGDKVGDAPLVVSSLAAAADGAADAAPAFTGDACAGECGCGDGSRSVFKTPGRSSQTPNTALGVRIYRPKNKTFFMGAVSRYTLLGAASSVDAKGTLVLR